MTQSRPAIRCPFAVGLHYTLVKGKLDRRAEDGTHLFGVGMVDHGLIERIRRAAPGLTEPGVAELAAVIARLVASLEPERIYLFGSQVRGMVTRDSDIDLLLVVPNTDVPPHRLARQAYRAASPYTRSYDLLVMPRAEFERRSRAVASLPAAVLHEGRVLYVA